MDVDWYEDNNISFVLTNIQTKYNYSLLSNTASKDEEYIENIENKKTVLLKQLDKYPNAVIDNIFWLNDNKSVVIGITLACGLVECEKGSESIIGVYKVNVDGTNWQKIKDIPNYYWY